MLKTVSIDFEFKNTNEKNISVVCGALEVDGETRRYWLVDNEDRDQFIQDWDELMAEGRAIISYMASAESRAFLALGYSPKTLLSWSWLDPFIFWKMLTLSHPSFMWGRKFITRPDGKRAMITTTRPPEGEISEDEIDWAEGGKVKRKAKEEHKRINAGLVDAVAHRFGIDMNADNKSAMVDLILNTRIYTPVHRKAILEYCASDVKHLLPLTQDLLDQVFKATDESVKLKHLFRLSRYTVINGIVESNGLPILVDKAENLGRNVPLVEDKLIEECNKVYQFFEKVKLTPAEIKKGKPGTHKWVEKRERFSNYLKSAGMASHWPRTDTGGFKCDADTLKDYEGDAVIRALRVVKKSKGNLRYFKPEAWLKMKSHIGSDNRVRPSLSPFGTITGRHTPRPTQGYILAMSSWLRPLIAEPGKVVIGGDFSSEEMFLQGWVSEDENLLAGCRSGDIYLWLAKYCGAMDHTISKSPEGYRDADGNLLNSDGQLKCKLVRNTFKGLALGLGYGMGLALLAVKLTASRIEALPQEQKNILAQARVDPDPTIQAQAEEILKDVRVVPGIEESCPDNNKASVYRDYHKKTFSTYWSWRDSILADFHADGFISTPDGWTVFEGANDQTVANFLIQGTGGTILRRAMERCILAGLHVCAPLHDAIYAVSDPENVDRDLEILVREMEAAVEDVCGEPLIKVDAHPYITDWDAMVSPFAEKQANEFKALGKYMLS